MFAVIETGGKQYKIALGDVIKIEKLPGEAGAKVVFDKVLLTDDDKTTEIGAPYLEGVVVRGEILAQDRAPKVQGVKYKAKSNYRVKYGHRQHITKVKITSIK